MQKFQHGTTFPFYFELIENLKMLMRSVLQMVCPTNTG